MNLFSFSDQALSLTEQGTLIPITELEVLSPIHQNHDSHVQEPSPEEHFNECQGTQNAITEQNDNDFAGIPVRDREVYRFYASRAGYTNTALFLLALGACQASNNLQCSYYKIITSNF